MRLVSRRNLLIISAVLAVAAAPGLLAQGAGDEQDFQQTVARVAWLTGESSLQRGDDPDNWQPLAVNVPLTIGDRVYASPTGRLEREAPRRARVDAVADRQRNVHGQRLPVVRVVSALERGFTSQPCNPGDRLLKILLVAGALREKPGCRGDRENGGNNEEIAARDEAHDAPLRIRPRPNRAASSVRARSGPIVSRQAQRIRRQDSRARSTATRFT